MDSELMRLVQKLSIKEPGLTWPVARRKLAALAGVNPSEVPDSFRDEWDNLRLAALEFQRDRISAAVTTLRASLRARGFAR